MSVSETAAAVAEREREGGREVTSVGRAMHTDAPNPGGQELQLIVQQYEIRIGIKVQSSLLPFDAQALGRMQRGRLDGKHTRTVCKGE